MKRFLWGLTHAWWWLIFISITGSLIYLALFQREWIGTSILLIVFILHITFFIGLLIDLKKNHSLPDIVKRYLLFFAFNYLWIIEVPIYIIYVGIMIFKWIALVLGLLIGLPVFIAMVLKFRMGVPINLESGLDSPQAFIIFASWILLSILLLLWHTIGNKKWQKKYPNLPDFGERIRTIREKLQDRIPSIGH